MAIDCVLFSKKGNKIVCIIKLDDPSHERVERIIRDRWLNTIMTFAQILLDTLLSLNWRKCFLSGLLITGRRAVFLNKIPSLPSTLVTVTSAL